MFAITERLLLRPAWPEDVLRLDRAIRHETSVRGTAGDPLGGLLAARADRLRPSFLICLRDDGEPIGAIGLHGRVAELHCWIAAPHRRRGIASEAGRAVLALGDGSLRIDRIVARHLPVDVAGARLLARLGFTADPARSHAEAIRLSRQGLPVRSWAPALAA